MKNRRAIIWPLIIVAVAAFLYALGIGRTRIADPKRGDTRTKEKGDPWLTATREIVRQPDAVTARRVLNQLNSDLDAANQTLPLLSHETASKYAAIFRPSPDEAKDWASKNFTPMDGNYLGESLFFRAVARSLDVDGLTDEQKAAAAFDWVCRQIYLRPWMMPGPDGPVLMPALPPQEVLRRGYGTGVEREVAFLALARQLGLDAVLVGPPGAEAELRYELLPHNLIHRGLFWAVGVRVDDDVILFDPWFGEAFPGPDGKGIARLSAAKTTPSLVIHWIEAKKANFPAKLDDVTGATTYLAIPLNSLTPRIALLETQLASQIGVKLAVNVKEIASRCAKLPGGPAKWYSPPINVDPFTVSHGLGVFMPVIEGGYDPRPADQRQLAFVAREIEPISNAPRLFTIPQEITFGTARQEFIKGCAGVYKRIICEPGYREKIQRGQFNDAAGQLVERENYFNKIRETLRSDEVVTVLNEWYREANTAYEKLRLSNLPERAAERPQAEAAVAALWGEKSPIHAAILGAVAEVGFHEVAYLLALCKHEQAERSQTRYRKAGPSAETAAQKAAEDWGAAKARWANYLEGSKAHDDNHPGRREHAQKLAARAEALAANPSEERQ